MLVATHYYCVICYSPVQYMQCITAAYLYITTYCRQTVFVDVAVVFVELQVCLAVIFYVAYMGIEILDTIVLYRIISIYVCEYVFIVLVRILHYC